ncbi:hypothetical protein H5410_015849 [Solanum commersonii]|uniref:Uncharacterized protein n=1 Tax=Solanum commersonii TaxID=4109 RepID=A0A9J5ZUU8_SOLCO|nr:hypothetical protein H5410_015849 [Solanum commersonii]
MASLYSLIVPLLSFLGFLFLFSTAVAVEIQEACKASNMPGCIGIGPAKTLDDIPNHSISLGGLFPEP